jgi:tetratricopeptide (TPR) repeat protein
MARSRTVATWSLAALALIAFALWPAYIRRSESEARAAMLPTAAPVKADYATRDKEIAFWEGMMRENNHQDMISPRKAAEAYLQRYRERGDIGDVLRAETTAELSLRRQPHGNIEAEVNLASVDLTLHRFKDALFITKFIERQTPNVQEMSIREASLDLEIGDYGAAKRILDRLPPAKKIDISRETLQTRYDELTGHLAKARDEFAYPTAEANSYYDTPAQTRAWFYFRSGELAYEAGANDEAIADEDQALAIFPNYSEANRFKARFECALHRWQACLTDATASANVVPYPETLGYEADAQRALGDSAGAARTDDLITTIEKIGNTQHISDRLLAIYYSEHKIHVDDAYRIAKRELLARDDILTEDTLAWAAAMDGRWSEARTHMARAIRFDTENSLMQYHAGVIALHFGDAAAAKGRFAKALALNPSFHPFYADDARAQLARL